MVRGSTPLLLLGALTPDLVPPRLWLERLAFLAPGTTATRWLLVADLVCLVVLGSAARRPLVGISVALALGFLALNVAAMAVTDFYLGLALFHLGVGVTAAALLRRARWVGLALVVTVLVLGALT